ncbi:MAG: sodium-translocating pyrophosphatase [Planctomycetota bacterium]|nr:MAG: sodium-translocating pyrophosphatase [Planctomycetota bacterium]
MEANNVNVLLLADLSTLATEAWVWFIAPVAAVAALVAAFLISRSVMAHSEGEPDMIEIAAAVRDGAMAYLKRQYKVVAIVFAMLLVVLVGLGVAGILHWVTPIGVLGACLFSGLCGWFGMKMATNASARTTFAAKQSLNDGLRVAFHAGAVMGLIVVGFALLDISVWFAVWNTFAPKDMTLVGITTVMLTYGMGASTQALFARVGGGIFTKAADVGADLVGKIEAGIPEDDPRNPATIADNVGDNVGDVAGMGADLYESYYGSILASMALGAAAAYGLVEVVPADKAAVAMKLAVAPMALAGIGIFASLLGVRVVRTKEDASFSQLLKSLHMGVWVASLVTAIGAAFLFMVLLKDIDELTAFGFGGLRLWGSILSGLIAGLVIAFFTEYYTSYEHKPTRMIAEQAETGPATVIIAGTAVGMISTWAPIGTIVIAIITAFTFAGGNDNFLLGLYGVGIAAVGMLSTLGITLATDAYGPIADNAGGNAQMTGQPAFVRERTDMLDSLGNTTAATGKGFAIGSAALTALALLAAYVSVVQTSVNSQLIDGKDPATVAGGMTAMYVAEYQGHGQFTVASRTRDDNLFGGLLMASDRVRGLVEKELVLHDTYPINNELDEDTNSFHLSLAGHNVQIIPADRATMQQVLAFYDVTLMNPRVLGGIFLGVLLAFVFCALTMQAVGRAAHRMMNECRRQFAIMREGFKADGLSEADIADPMKWPRKVIVAGHQYPDYAECVAISTAGAQKEMIVPSIMAIAAPVAVGLVLGVGGVMGLLCGGLTSGFALAIFMANAGGAWDNAKKYIEMGHHGGKGSDAHKAGVVGDTVGDPFKDTSGPSLNILIKLIAIVSVVFAGLIVKFSPAIMSSIGLS